MIRITEHLSLPARYVCPTCLVSTPYQLGECWQVCLEMHFTKDRSVVFEGGTRVEGEVPVEIKLMTRDEVRAELEQYSVDHPKLFKETMENLNPDGPGDNLGCFSGR